MRGRTAIAAVVGLWLVVTLVVSSGLLDDPGDGDLTLGQPTILLASLTPFGACDELLDHLREHALEQVTPYGLGGDMWGYADDVGMDMEDDAAADGGAAPRAAAATGTVAGEDFSGTNVQEVGVDEPDLVKTDGRTLYTTVGDRIRAFDVTGEVPRQIGSLRLEGEPWGRELLLDGDRLLVLATAHSPVRPLPMPMPVDELPGGAPPPDELAADDMEVEVDPLPGASGRYGIMPMGSPAATLTLVDVADPTRMAVTETLTLDGSYLSARLVDGIARVVVRSEPVALPFVYPTGGGIRAEEAALERNRQVIRDSQVADWLPFFVHVDGSGRRTDGTLLDCTAVHRPGAFSGLGTVSVLTVDPADGLRPQGGTAVLAGGETIAASTDRLYIATARWEPTPDPTAGTTRPAPWPGPDGDMTTELHAFDITGAAARYVGSGSVPGHLLNQFAISEHAGYLRVATTRGQPFWWGGEEGGASSDSRVAVLTERGGDLVEVGAVEGLGPDERIYAVRFLGDVGYVVTFRETDPLYTIDLRDPADPRVLGELKIPGFSSYLHPIGDGLVLGIGQDADEQGMRLGAQASLFDVSDLADPRRVATLQLGGEGSSSDVEHDHRAFLWWPATRTAIAPVTQWRWDEETETEDVRLEAVGFTAGPGGLAELGRASHTVPPAAPEGARPDQLWDAGILRSIVVGDRLLTLSSRGVLASDLATLAPLGFGPFDR
jgi:hypothetical protein